MLEYVSGKILLWILFIPVVITYGLDEERFEKAIHKISPSIADLISIKMLNNKYMIPTNVIDCPIVIKQKLYKMLDYNDYYIANKGGDLVLCNADMEETTYVTYINKESPDLDPFIDWNMKYSDEVRHLLSQLQEGEFYSITDIITDKQVKYARGN